MHRISLLALMFTGAATSGLRHEPIPADAGVTDRQRLLIDFLQIRAINGPPVVPSLVVLCSPALGITLDSAFTTYRNEWHVRDSIVVGNCNRVPYDIDSVSLRRTRQVIHLHGLEVAQSTATISAEVYWLGQHTEVARFTFGTRWGLRSITLQDFFQE